MPQQQGSRDQVSSRKIRKGRKIGKIQNSTYINLKKRFWNLVGIATFSKNFVKRTRNSSLVFGVPRVHANGAEGPRQQHPSPDARLNWLTALQNKVWSKVPMRIGGFGRPNSRSVRERAVPAMHLTGDRNNQGGRVGRLHCDIFDCEDPHLRGNGTTRKRLRSSQTRLRNSKAAGRSQEDPCARTPL